MAKMKKNENAKYCESSQQLEPSYIAGTTVTLFIQPLLKTGSFFTIYHTAHNPIILFLDICPKKYIYICASKVMYENAHSSIISNSQMQ